MKISNHVVVTNNLLNNLLNKILVADAKATHPTICNARIVRVVAINAMTFAQRGDEVKRLNLDIRCLLHHPSVNSTCFYCLLNCFLFPPASE